MLSVSFVLSAVLLSCLAFVVSFLITPVTVKISRLCGAVDLPDGKRKINTRAVPRLGGVGFIFSFAVTVIILILHEGVLLGVSEGSYLGAIIAAGSILAASGISDDCFSLSPMLKLLLQSAAAALAMLLIPMPSSFSFFGILTVPINGLLGYIFVLFRLMFMINAVNFSDGLDGLASGLSIVALLSLSFYGLVNMRLIVSVTALILASAVGGFLPYNRYHARLYMGDVGSQFLGLSIAILSLGASRNNAYTIEASFFLAVPMLDTALSVIRRLLKGKSPFVADKGHLHHVLLGRGVAHPRAVKILISLSAVIAAASLLMYV